jgi:hypothetical protein
VRSSVTGRGSGVHRAVEAALGRGHRASGPADLDLAADHETGHRPARLAPGPHMRVHESPSGRLTPRNRSDTSDTRNPPPAILGSSRSVARSQMRTGARIPAPSASVMVPGTTAPIALGRQQAIPTHLDARRPERPPAHVADVERDPAHVPGVGLRTADDEAPVGHHVRPGASHPGPCRRPAERMRVERLDTEGRRAGRPERGPAGGGAAGGGAGGQGQRAEAGGEREPPEGCPGWPVGRPRHSQLAGNHPLVL